MFYVCLRCTLTDILGSLTAILRVLSPPQVYLAEILKSLMRSERNQQVMCDAGLPCELISTCRLALEDENHLLHPAIQYMLERLAAQTLEPRDLRSVTPAVARPQVSDPGAA